MNASIDPRKLPRAALSTALAFKGILLPLVGSVIDWAKVYDEFEEGGYRQSGLGRLNGVAAIDDFIEYKHITLSTAD